MSIILKNATFIDWKTLVFTKTNLLIEEGEQGKVKFINSIPKDTSAEIIDCTNMYVTKSFVCGHHHAYSALSRGMGSPKKNRLIFMKFCNTFGGHSTNV